MPMAAAPGLLVIPRIRHPAAQMPQLGKMTEIKINHVTPCSMAMIAIERGRIIELGTQFAWKFVRSVNLVHNNLAASERPARMSVKY